jgi:sugar O-acyltransferase (sialic acid O-acetyltransferase NeuD family)
MRPQSVFVYGAGGHAKVVMDVLERDGRHSVTFLVDDDVGRWGSTVGGHQVRGGRDALLRERDATGIAAGVVAIGHNAARDDVASALVAGGFSLVVAVHPSAQIAASARLGQGTVVMANAVVNPGVSIGSNVIVNTGANVDHDCVVGDAVHIAPGATICGGVRVGARSRVYAGATVINDITIGVDATIGAGAVVIRDVPDGATVVGVPARRIER